MSGMARKHNYVVGYQGEKECVYGREMSGEFPQYAIPMTMNQAKRYAKKGIPYHGNCSKMVVYKLVVVK